MSETNYITSNVIEYKNRRAQVRINYKIATKKQQNSDKETTPYNMSNSVLTNGKKSLNTTAAPSRAPSRSWWTPRAPNAR